VVWTSKLQVSEFLGEMAGSLFPSKNEIDKLGVAEILRETATLPFPVKSAIETLGVAKTGIVFCSKIVRAIVSQFLVQNCQSNFRLKIMTRLFGYCPQHVATTVTTHFAVLPASP
jgi:hypothetical protein